MQVEPGTILKGKISGITAFGAFVDLEGGATGLVHISEISNEYVKDVHDHVKVGDEVEVKVLPFEKGAEQPPAHLRIESTDIAFGQIDHRRNRPIDTLIGGIVCSLSKP